MTNQINKEETTTDDSPQQIKQGTADNKNNGLLSFTRETIELIVITLFLLISIRWLLAEARYIPSSSMEPTLQIEDRILVEKISGHLHRPYQRGEILVFYPPPSELGGKDLSNNPLYVLGRLTGLPFLPYEPAYIKRAIGLPGDTIRIIRGVGVYINGQLLDESSYVKEKPNYNLMVLGDIGMTGRMPYPGRPVFGIEDSLKPIVVPPGHLL